jgi:hypothetical protein
VEDDVLRLQVAVDDLTLMHVIQSPADLLHDYTSQLLVELPLLLEEGVELPRGAELLHQINMRLVCEESVKLDHVGVVEEGLDLYLPHQLHQ